MTQLTLPFYNPPKVYPSQMPGRVHPCKAKGMTDIGFWIWPEKKQKMAHYCKMKSISMTDLFHRLVARELEENYDKTYQQRLMGQPKRLRMRRRGVAYRYILTRINH